MLPDDLDVRSFLQAEVLHSFAVRIGEDAETRASEITDLVWKLLRRSRSPSGVDEEESAAGIDALLLARFLATAGHEEAER